MCHGNFFECLFGKFKVLYIDKYFKVLHYISVENCSLLIPLRIMKKGLVGGKLYFKNFFGYDRQGFEKT